MILIVEDHADTRYLLARLLRGEGYESAAAASAIEALELLETMKPTLVITDYTMPGMDGLTLFERLRADERFKHIPVLMFSAVGGMVRERALAAGVDAFISKDSMDWATLQREVTRLAGPGRGEKALPDVQPQRARDAG